MSEYKQNSDVLDKLIVVLSKVKQKRSSETNRTKVGAEAHAGPGLRKDDL